MTGFEIFLIKTSAILGTLAACYLYLRNQQLRKQLSKSEETSKLILIDLNNLSGDYRDFRSETRELTSDVKRLLAERQHLSYVNQQLNSKLTSAKSRLRKYKREFKKVKQVKTIG